MDPDGAGEGERAARADTGTGRVLAAQVKMHRLLRRVGQETIQLHGGIGMTDAYALAQLVRRMLAIELALGSADAALARYAALARDD
jgi:alkylation response protein AidB-like acyl-CoA dehydrogenase